MACAWESGIAAVLLQGVLSRVLATSGNNQLYDWQAQKNGRTHVAYAVGSSVVPDYNFL